MKKGLGKSVEIIVLNSDSPVSNFSDIQKLIGEGNLNRILDVLSATENNNGGKTTVLDLTGEESNDLPQIENLFHDMQESKVIGQEIVDKLAGVLNTIKDFSLKNEFQQKFNEFKSDLTSAITDNAEISPTTRDEVLEIIDSLSDIQKNNLIINLFETSKLYDSAPNIENPNIHAEHYSDLYKYIGSSLIKALKSYSLQKILDMYDLDSGNYLENIRSLYETICRFTADESFMRESSLDTDEQSELERKLVENYPNVGKSNLLILKKQEKLQGKYLIDVKTRTSETFAEYLQQRKSYYEMPGDGIKDMLNFMTSLFLSKDGFKRYYKYFIESYMDDLFSVISQRKNPSRTNSNPKGNNPENGDMPTISTKENKTKECPAQINNFLDNALSVFADREDIKKYIIRLYSNGKSIRINDMIYKFPETKDLFTNKFLLQSSILGIKFEIGNGKKTKEPNIQKKTTKIEQEDKTEDAPVQVEDEVKIAFERKIDWFLRSPALLDGKGFVDLMKLAGYEIEKETYVAKCFKRLYHNAQMKQIFLTELKKNIFFQEKVTRKKSSYRKINISPKRGHRILFINNNKTINGIYNHDDYEDRRDSILGG